MLVKPIKTRIFKEGENLFSFITPYLKNIKENSVVIITSKIIALSEKRTAIIENIQTKEKLIKQESSLAIPTKYIWLTIKDGVVMASAGIDESNAQGKLILLPRNSFKTASLLRKKLQTKYKLKNLGIIITDSRTAPLKAGVLGVAVGYAGFKGINDYRGQADIFGRKFHFSRANVADSLAAAAVIAMGEGKEQQPLAIIENSPAQFCNRIKKDELKIDIKQDMYRPLFENLDKIKIKKKK